jgi:hypothetical protein
MKCPWCGADSPVGAITCYNCGITWSAENGPKPSPNEIRWQNQPQPQYRPTYPSQQPPGKLYRKKQPNYMMIVGIIVVIVLLLVLVSIAIIASNNALNNDTSGNRIVGPLDGTWRTDGVTIFYMRTSWSTGQLTDVGYEGRNVTFDITGTSDPEKVDVEMSYSVVYSSIQYDSFYSPDPSPEHYDGFWNGTNLWLSQNGIQKGVFTFTDTTITGTWDDLDQDSYFSQECYTVTNGLTLQRPWVMY